VSGSDPDGGIPGPTGDPGTADAADPVGFLRRRRVAFAATSVLLVGYLLATFCIVAAVTHRGWQSPGDFWANYQLAHDVAIGDYAHIYFQSSLLSPPAILFVLIPFVQVTSHFGLTTGYGIAVARPSAWPVVAPVIVLLGSSALFGADALAEALGVGVRRRLVAGLVGALVLGNVLWWGHPEDAVAVAFLLYAVRAAIGRRWSTSAWLLGFGMAFQPMIVLAIPVILLPAGWRRLPGLVARVAALPVVLLVVPFLGDPSSTYRAVAVQPVIPALVRPTVWMRFAPHIGNEVSFGGAAVAGGPVRLVAGAAALALGLWFMRRERRPEVLVWCVAVTLALRFLFDVGVAPYYVWPPLAAALVAASTRSPTRLALTGTAAVAVTWLANVRVLTAWLWWPIAAGVVLTLVLAAPRRSPPATEPSTDPEAPVLVVPATSTAD